ncbi:long polar fimbrial protein LpfD [Enterobacter bugandensis]|uniref:long polar fimbrial protein LpfD n=1 Tax=Enterobacter bugandensis TaxID=881260 RepID=UPI0023630872|nr:long polar fimbrial protein LpfD [Enterobacter bugandensis]
MFKKLITIAGLLGGAALSSGQAIAAADFGPCTPERTQVYSTNINKTVADISKNVTGATFIDFDSWNLGGSYAMSCECPDDTKLTNDTLFKAVVPLPFLTTIEDRKYFQINNNIAIASDVLIQGGRKDYLKTPFENEGNLAFNRNSCSQDESSKEAVWGSGSKGHLSLYIIHPFVGESIIPNTKIMDLFATKKRDVYGSIPASSVFLSGSIIIPQGCELSSGSTLEIPFGEFKASDFKDRKGQIAKNATIFTKELQFKCTNISDGVKIFLHIEGMPNANDSNAIDMGNPDIGAVIKGENGKILVPNDINANQELSVSGLVDDTHRTASTTISAYPISTTGKLPAAGEFEGIATMRIDVE